MITLMNNRYEYWRDKFIDRGYVLIDWLRGAIKENMAVDAWYRYNIMCFVKQGPGPNQSPKKASCDTE